MVTISGVKAREGSLATRFSPEFVHSTERELPVLVERLLHERATGVFDCCRCPRLLMH